MKNFYLFKIIFAPFYPKLNFFWATLFACLLVETTQAQTITGIVFQDFNSNGIRETSGNVIDNGVSGITVTAYGNGTSFSAITNSTGTYTLNTGAGNFRVEFTNLVPNYFDTFSGTNSNTSVRFATGGSTVDFGINRPAQYCQTSPPIAVPCYPFGMGSPTEQVIVSLSYTASGNNTTFKSMLGSPAPASSASVTVGAVWGSAYRRTSADLFSAAFMKRHSAFGNGGPGAIIRTVNANIPTQSYSTAFVTLNAGVNSHNTADYSKDQTRAGANPFDDVGKIGLGDMDISPDDRYLYVVNLFDRRLYRIEVDADNNMATNPAPADITSYAFPTVACPSGQPRPFGLGFNAITGNLYAGITCDGSSNTNPASASALSARIFEFNTATQTFNPTPILNFSLDYPRGVINDGEQVGSTNRSWRTWISNWNWNSSIPNVPQINRDYGFYPQPLLSDIVFDVDGSLILGITDRFSHQVAPYSWDGAGLLQYNSTMIAGGDILRACNIGTLASPSYVVDVFNGGKCGTAGNGTTGRNSDGGLTLAEFYSDEYIDPYHYETALGGLALVPGTNQVITSIMDPNGQINANGISFMDNTTGDEVRDFVIVEAGNLFSKGASLGDVEVLCSPAPIQIGNRVWVDSNNNGTQDPGEPPLAGIVVVLKGPGLPAAGVSVTTNSAGEYYFANIPGTAATGYAYSLTTLVPGGAYSLTFPMSLSTGTYVLSKKPDSATGINANAIDTDASSAGVISFTLGGYGQNNFTYDAGYVLCTLTASLQNATICNGQSATLTVSATGGTSFTLLNTNTVNTTGIFSVSPSATTTYTVVVSDPNNCTARATATVTVNPLPTPTLNSPVLCNGQSATLTATAGVGFSGVLYDFGSGNTPVNTLIVNPSTTTPYNVTVTSAQGCTAVATGTVTVNPLPVATLSSATICRGQTINLTATGGTQYNFGGGNSATNTLPVSPTANTTYSVTVTSAQGCTATATGTVTVNPLPVATLSSATICRGVPATLVASGGVQYNFGTGSSATNTLVVNPTANATYSVTATNASGCTAVATGNVTVNPLPVATLSSATICEGASATLTAGGGTQYNFGNGPMPQTTEVVSPMTTTIYTVTVTSGAGCTATAQGTVVVNTLPNAALSSATICRGQTATLTATGGIQYNFGSGNSATSTFVISPTATGNYAVTVTNAAGCTALEIGTVTVNPLPTPTLSGAVICAGTSATLTATGGTSYTFSNGTINATGKLEVSPSATMPFTVTATNNFGCRATATNTVTVNPVPIATLSAGSATVCDGTSTTLTASGGAVGGPFTYEFGSSVNTSGVLVVNPSQTTTYSVVVTSAQGCTASASRVVTVNPVPAIAIVPANPVVCRGSSGTLSADGCTGTVRWSTGETTTTIVISPTVSTTYTLVCTTPQGCTTAAESEVTVSVPGSVSVSSNDPVCPGQPIFLSASGTGNIYRWAGPGGFTGTTASVSIAAATAANAGVYSVTISGGLCAGVGSTSVVVNPAAIATLSSTSICDGQSATLTATAGTGLPGTSYEFTGGSIANTTGRLVVSPSQTTIYSVIATNANGCTATANGTVTLHPSVTATLSSATICKGNTAALSMSGGVAYTYDGGNTTGSVIVVNPLVTTVYTITATNAQGCFGTARNTVTVNELPVATLSSATICRGETATLTATGGVLYEFSNGTTNSTGILVLSPTATTNYTVVVTDGNGCKAEATGSIVVRNLPPTTLTSATICAGRSATLTASGGTEYDFGTGPTTTAVLVVRPMGTTTYTVIAYTAEGCSASATGTVTVNALPTPTLTGGTICVGQSVTLAATGGGLYDFGYGPTATPTQVESPTALTTYYVSVTNAAGCSAMANTTVMVNPLPIPTLSGGTICVGETLTLTASGGSGQPGAGLSGTTYNFGTGNSATNTLVVSPTATTTYTVVVTNGSGCTATTQSTVVVNTLPVAQLTSATICDGETATLVAAGGSGQSGLRYDFGSGDQPAGILVLSPKATETYSVTVTNAAGCTATTTGTITVNPTPTITITSVSCVGLTTYTVNFTATAGAIVTSNVGTVAGNQIVGIPSGQTVVVTATLGSCSAVTGASEDCQRFAASLGNFVWEDLNGNGQQDSGEPGIGGVVVTLISNGSVVATTTTNPNGLYSFTGLTPYVPYSVSFAAPTGFTATRQNNASSTTLDSDGNPATGLTTSYTLAPAENNPTIDMGYYRPAQLGDQVFVDFDGNGVQGPDEPPLAGVIVSLVVNGSVVATATTGSDGLYSFTGLTPGVIYTVNFSTPTGYNPTTYPSGNTPPTSLTSGEVNLTLDGGFLPVYNLGIEKAVVSAGPYVPGRTVTYAITVTNYSLLPVYNVEVADHLPTGLSFVSGAGFSASGSNSLSALVPGPISASGTVSLTLTAVVTSGFSTSTISNTAIITRFTSTTNRGGPPGFDNDSSNDTTVVGIQVLNYASLGNYVWNDINRDGVQDANEPPVEGVTVTLYLNGSAIATTTTSASGLYSFTGLVPGSDNVYVVGFTNIPPTFTATVSNQGGNDALDSDAVGGLTGPVTLTSGENNPTLDAGFYKLRFDLALTKSVLQAPNPLLPGSLVSYNVVLINEGELPAINTIVTDTPAPGLVFSAANSPEFTNTGSSQTALVASLLPGESVTLTVAYTVMSSNTAPLTNRVEVTSDSGDDVDSTPGNSGPNPDEDDTGLVTIQPVAFAALGNFVWEDLNANGQQDSGEPGIDGIVVSLIQNGSVVASTTTTAGGIYSFTGLTPGVFYQVQFGEPTGYWPSPTNTGDDATDSDRDPATGLSQSVSMVGGETNPTLDAGFYRPATLGDQVFIDRDGDGIQNNGEPPLEGVTVTLISNGSVVATVTTGPDGLYSFTGLTPGVVYSVSFTPPAGYSATTFPTGISQSVTLASGQVNNTLDAGFEQLKPAYTLTKRVSTNKASLGEVVSYTITLANTGPVAGTGIVVNDRTTDAITMVPESASVSSGTFTPDANGGSWALSSLPSGATATLTYSASLLAEGVLYNTASLSGVPSAQVCTSVPFRVCKGTDYAVLLEAPAGYQRYQWLLTAPGSISATVVYDGPLTSFTATLPGEYAALVDDGVQGLCAQPSCCSVFIEETEVPSFTALVQTPTCIGTTPQANGQLQLIGLGTDPGSLYSYQYTAGTSFTAGIATPVSPAPVPANGVIATTLTEGTYVVRVTDRLNGCTRDLIVVVPPANCACPEEICIPVVIKKTKSLGRDTP